MSKPATPGPTRFWPKVTRGSDSECWIWTAGTNKPGYGRFNTDGFVWLAHRYAYTLLVGPIPAEMTLDHLCHTRDTTCPGGRCRHRLCVNPAHLEVVSLAVNKDRGRSLWSINAKKEVCSRGGHPLALRSDGKGRRCPTCDRAAATVSNARVKAERLRKE